MVEPEGIVFLEQFMMTTLATDYEVACIHGNGGADYEYGNFDAMCAFVQRCGSQHRLDDWVALLLAGPKRVEFL